MGSVNETERIRVMIVDDHQLVRDGLNLLLSTYDEFDIVGMAEDGEKAVALCHSLRPDVILMDIAMPNLDGPDATGRILAGNPDIKVIALTSFMEDVQVQRAIGAGASGYLLKNVSPEQLASAIRDAHRGRPTIDAEAARILVQASHHPQAPGHDLTDREREVLALMVEGKTNKEIALALNLSPTTVRDYVSSILGKLGANNRTEAVALALQNNILS